MASNPNKVNQYTQPDPRQSLFLACYLDPKSETFSNALQSGIKAGYTEEYSKTLMSQLPDWLSESICDTQLLKKAEKRLNQLLDFEPIDEEGKIDNSLLANQMKAINLVAKGIGKAKYSERVEQNVQLSGTVSLSELNNEQLEKLITEAGSTGGTS
jgi:hypothetical protein